MKGPRESRNRSSRRTLSRPDRLNLVLAKLSLSVRDCLHGAPPRDALVPRRVREPDQQIAVARPRCAEVYASGEEVIEVGRISD